MCGVCLCGEVELHQRPLLPQLGASCTCALSRTTYKHSTATLSCKWVWAGSASGGGGGASGVHRASESCTDCGAGHGASVPARGGGCELDFGHHFSLWQHTQCTDQQERQGCSSGAGNRAAQQPDCASRADGERGWVGEEGGRTLLRAHSRMPQIYEPPPRIAQGCHNVARN